MTASDGSDVMSDRWPKLGSPEDADATHRWARACLEMWEAERADLLAEVERLRKDAKLAAAIVRINPEVAGRAELEAEVERLREALEQIKRVCAIEAPPVSGDAHAKAWQIAYDALASDITALPPEGEAR